MLKRASLITSVLLTLCSPVFAQQEWLKIAPAGQAFTVSMPTAATATSRLIPLNDKDSVPEQVYYSIANGRRYMIVSFVRTKADRTSALSSFTEFMSAMEQSFVSKDGEVRSLIFDQNLSDESGIVKQYQLQLGEYRGVAHFIGTEKMFYAQMVIGADENDPDVRTFLKSFEIGPINKDDESSNVVRIDGSGPTIPPEPWPKTVSPISGGVLNGKAVLLATPEYPQAARKNHDEGMVKVRIVIDELGKVIDAEAIEGPETLREAAVDAAFKSLFTPTRLMGQPVKVAGVIMYNFVAR